MPDYGNDGRLAGGAAGRVRSFDDRRDLLNEIDNSIYGGGNAPATPTPSPTPNPSPVAGTMKVSDSPLYNVPPLYRDNPYGRDNKINIYDLTQPPPTLTYPLNDLVGRKPQTIYDAVLRYYTPAEPSGPPGTVPAAEPTPQPTATPGEFFMQNQPSDQEMNDMRMKYGFNYG